MTDAEQTCARGCCKGPNAQRDHYRGVQLGKGATSEQVADITRRDKQLDKDREAYKRLRADGLQPNSVDGSARLEQRVIDQVEIDYKIPIKEKDLPRVKEIQAQIAMGTPSGSVNS